MIIKFHYQEEYHFVDLRLIQEYDDIYIWKVYCNDEYIGLLTSTARSKILTLPHGGTMNLGTLYMDAFYIKIIKYYLSHREEIGIYE